MVSVVPAIFYPPQLPCDGKPSQEEEQQLKEENRLNISLSKRELGSR